MINRRWTGVMTVGLVLLSAILAASAADDEPEAPAKPLCCGEVDLLGQRPPANDKELSQLTRWAGQLNVTSVDHVWLLRRQDGSQRAYLLATLPFDDPEGAALFEGDPKAPGHLPARLMSFDPDDSEVVPKGPSLSMYYAPDAWGHDWLVSREEHRYGDDLRVFALGDSGVQIMPDHAWTELEDNRACSPKEACLILGGAHGITLLGLGVRGFGRAWDESRPLDPIHIMGAGSPVLLRQRFKLVGRMMALDGPVQAIGLADLDAEQAALTGTAVTIGSLDLKDAFDGLLREMAQEHGQAHDKNEDGQSLWDVCGDKVVESPLARLVALTGQDHGWDLQTWAKALEKYRRFP